MGGFPMNMETPHESHGSVTTDLQVRNIIWNPNTEINIAMDMFLQKVCVIMI